LPKITNGNQLVENNQINESFLLLMTPKQVTSRKTLEDILNDMGRQGLEI
jgi:hypothetical protein